jgi:lysophospholipid acyltransferase (LPLAT)-like uncharacterized protein
MAGAVLPNLKEWAAGNSLYLLSELTRRTGRFHIEGLPYLEQSQAQGPTILTAWHGMTMMLAGFLLNHYDPGRLVIIMPDDWRGATLAVWAAKFGAQALRLNLKGDPTMATARQLTRLVRLVKKGDDCYITPDGPDGPAYVIKPGVAFIAQKTGATLLPLGAYTRRGYRLNRWDQYVVPYPYGRIAIVIGPPVTIPAEDALTDVPAALTIALHQVSAQAAANYYEKA